MQVWFVRILNASRSVDWIDMLRLWLLLFG
jgi:hypothetical protein